MIASPSQSFSETQKQAPRKCPECGKDNYRTEKKTRFCSNCQLFVTTNYFTYMKILGYERKVQFFKNGTLYIDENGKVRGWN